MDWLQFIAAVVGSLAWPTVVGVLLYILRAQITGLAERVSTAEAIDYGDHVNKLVGSLSYALGYLQNEAKRVAEKQPLTGVRGRLCGYGYFKITCNFYPCSDGPPNLIQCGAIQF